MKDLHRITETLDKLKEEFNSQLSAIDDDTKNFHNAMIDLSAKYPDHKELLQFIVFVNDKLETNQNIFSEVIVESFNDLIDTKKDLIYQLENKGDKINIESEPTVGVMTLVDLFKDIKVLAISGAVFVAGLTVIFAPDKLPEILQFMKQILGM